MAAFRGGFEGVEVVRAMLTTEEESSLDVEGWRWRLVRTAGVGSGEVFGFFVGTGRREGWGMREVFLPPSIITSTL